VTMPPYCAPLDLAGERLWLDGRGAVAWPAGRVLVVADLHLAKGAALAAKGRLLPPYDSQATLARLVALVNDHRPERIVSLGDGFHRRDGWTSLAEAERAQLQALAAVTTWTWVHGNHDPEAPPDHGEAAAEVTLGPLVLRHLPAAAPTAAEVAGHLHPKAVVRVRGRRLARPCFVTDGRRLILPALGAYAGGLDVWDEAIAGLFDGPFDVLLCGRDGQPRRLPAMRLEGAPRRASSRPRAPQA
jgi:uncharacterized protein